MKKLLFAITLSLSMSSIASIGCDIHTYEFSENILKDYQVQDVKNALNDKGYNIVITSPNDGKSYTNSFSLMYTQTNQISYDSDVSNFELRMDEFFNGDTFSVYARVDGETFSYERHTGLFKLKKSTRLSKTLEIINQMPKCEI